MNILIANDDGFEARGIRTLAKALHEEIGADIYIFAPDSQRSASGHGISIHNSVEMWPVEIEHAKAAYALNGTPADCVAIGLFVMEEMGIRADMVFSGINHGSNVGTDTVYSGTVSCAMEGALKGVPSVAVSVDSFAPKHFEYACRLAVDAIKKTGGRWDPDIVLNINTPDIAESESKGICYTVLGDREYEGDIKQIDKEGDVTSFAYSGNLITYNSNALEYDVIAIQNGYASISTLHNDMTKYNGNLLLEKWGIGK